VEPIRKWSQAAEGSRQNTVQIFEREPSQKSVVGVQRLESDFQRFPWQDQRQQTEKVLPA